MKIEIKTMKFSPSQVREAIETSKLVYGDETDQIKPNAPVTCSPYVENKHLLNPLDRSIVIQLVQNDQVRGHIFLLERLFVFRHKQEQILVASDLVAKTNFPGSSLVLFRKAMSHCEDKKIPLLNFSNKESDLIYSKIMKIKPVIELDFKLGNFNLKSLFLNLNIIRNSLIVRHLSKTSSKPGHIQGNLQTQVVSEFNFLIDDFLDKLENHSICFGKRSSKILNWRFNKSNELDYDRILIYKGKEIVGYLVVCKRILKGIKFLIIVDFVLWQLNRKEKKNIQRVLKRMYSDTFACLWASNLQDTQMMLGKFSGFVLPRMFLQSRVKFYLSGGDENFERSLKFSFLTLFDTDIL
jgi:hypothetical protein